MNSSDIRPLHLCLFAREFFIFMCRSPPLFAGSWANKLRAMTFSVSSVPLPRETTLALACPVKPFFALFHRGFTGVVNNKLVPRVTKIASRITASRLGG